MAAGVQQQHQLLVVRPTAADARVQEHDATSVVHDAGKIARLLLVETEHLRMRAPQEPPDLDTSTRETGQHVAESRTPRSEKLIVVPPPIGEKDLVPGIEAGQTIDQPGEVHGPVDERLDMIAHGPGEIGLPTLPPAVAGFPRSSAERNHSDAPCIRLA